jgi:hypothetical protein
MISSSTSLGVLNSQGLRRACGAELLEDPRGSATIDRVWGPRTPFGREVTLPAPHDAAPLSLRTMVAARVLSRHRQQHATLVHRLKREIGWMSLTCTRVRLRDSCRPSGKYSSNAGSVGVFAGELLRSGVAPVRYIIDCMTVWQRSSLCSAGTSA